MKYQVALLAAGFAAQVMAQQSKCDAKAALIPSCAQACIKQVDAEVGCDAKDYKCGCDKQSEIQGKAAPCVLSACPAQSIAAVQSAAADLCKCASAAGTGNGGGSTPTPTPGTGGSGGQGGESGGAGYPTKKPHHHKTGGAPYPTASATESGSSYPTIAPAGNGTAYPTIATGLANAVQPMMAWTGAALVGVMAIAMI